MLGAVKARISAHMAAEGHLADVCAKESTQETLVALLGLLVGMAAASWVEGSVAATWALFAALLLLHQWANYRLIRCIVFNTLNPQRAFLVAQTLLPYDPLTDSFAPGKPVPPDPARIALKETLFRPLLLHIWGPQIGGSLSNLRLPSTASRDPSTAEPRQVWIDNCVLSFFIGVDRYGKHRNDYVQPYKHL